MGKRMFPVRLMGLKLYVQCFLSNLIFGFFFRKERNGSADRCEICKKPLIKRRIEVSLTRPELDYCFEFDKFLCIDHAIQFLHTYKRRIKE